MTRPLRLSDRLRALFARARGIPVYERAKYQEQLWGAEDYFGSQDIAPPLKDPWETESESETTPPSAEISKPAGSPAATASTSANGRAGSISGAGAATSPSVPLEKQPSFGRSTEAHSHCLIISNLRASRPKLEQSANTAAAVDGHRDLDSSASSANENKPIGLRHPQANDLRSRAQKSDADIQETSALREQAPVEAVENESLRYRDEWDFADDVRPDKNSEAIIEEQTRGEVAGDLDFELKDEQAFLDASAFDSPFDFDPLARQEPWNNKERGGPSTRTAYGALEKRRLPLPQPST